MPAPTFDIYRTRSGFTAVHDPRERRLLDALDDGTLAEVDLGAVLDEDDRDALPGIIESLQGRELLDRKAEAGGILRTGERIGSSYLTVPELRHAVRTYVQLSPLTGTLSLRAALEAVAQPADTPEVILRGQAEHLGRLVAQRWPVGSTYDRWMLLVDLLLEEQIATSGIIDREKGRVELVAETTLSIGAERLHLLIASLMDGIASASSDRRNPTASTHDGHRLVFTID